MLKRISILALTTLIASQAQAGVFKLDKDISDTSNLAWPFTDTRWNCYNNDELDDLGKPSSGFHFDADEYARDCAVSSGTPIYSVMGGKVIYADYHSVYGNQVIVLDSSGVFAVRYAHLKSIDSELNKFDIVHRESSKIGEVGSTGNSTGPHLHIVLYERLTSNDRALLLEGKQPSADKAALFKLDKFQRP